MKIISPPSLEPVTLGDVKTQLGITDVNSDVVISRRITQAREFAENYARTSLITQTLELRLNDFPLDLELPRGPIQSIVKIEYIDTSGVLQTVSASNYVFDAYDGSLRMAYGASWPQCRVERNAVRIQYIAGYGSIALNVPSLLRESIILIVGHWMNNQPQSESGVMLARIPFAVRDILDTYSLIKY